MASRAQDTNPIRDVVVTVPKNTWDAWIAEGDAAGDTLVTGHEWVFFVSTIPVRTVPGDRVYVVSHGKLRGYSLLTRTRWCEWANKWALCRGAGAVAVTTPEPIKGFQGWRYRWWNRDAEVPFPEWRTP